MDQVRLRIGTFTRSLLIELARRDGSLRRRFIDVEETLVTSSPSQFQSLEVGAFDLVFTSPDNVIAYRFVSANPLGRNLSVEIVTAIDRGTGLSLCLGPTVTSASELRGATVAVDVPQSGFAFVAYALLARAGLSRDDYQVVALGSTPQRAAALIKGDCAATVLNAGNELRAVGEGCRIESTVTQLGPYLGTVIAAMSSEDDVVNATRHHFAEAMHETIHSVLSGTRRADFIGAATELLGLTPDQAQLHYEGVVDASTGLVPDGVADLASMTTLIELRQMFAPTHELDVSVAKLLEDLTPLRRH